MTEKAEWGVGPAGPLPAPEWRRFAGPGTVAQRGPAAPLKRGDPEPGARSANALAGTARRSVAATTD
ncbi:hypothetical protein NDU88_012527 [Pleurodeles waltl]|uniref:Uncharacterized protein n=1 Tax=Pleurodeles waltl TaxID=8319 RepID=A0AAV7R0C2_PLEWA|nr:hypothetical protein NDU88_012527 [Pleurodeles waltl]